MASKAKLTPEQVRIAQEQKLKARTIPSGKIYKRKTKHGRDTE